MGILEKMSLAGKNAFVTGGARGIGKNYATGLAEAGANVAIIDINIDLARETAAELAKSTGNKVIALQADVTDPDEVNKFVDKVVEEFGTLDIAVNNAGITLLEAAETVSYKDWQRVIDLDLTAVFLGSQAAGKVMLKQGKGAIINTASMSGSIINLPQKQISYSAAKAGVIMLSKALAVEWAERGIRVNTISPGYIGTDLTLGDPYLGTIIKDWEAQSPMKRIGRPEELQGLIVYLAGDNATFTTGEDYLIDGAFTAI